MKIAYHYKVKLFLLISLQKIVRKKVIKVLKKWSGKLIEVPYTKNISYSKMKGKIIETGTTPEIRKSKLKPQESCLKIV